MTDEANFDSCFNSLAALNYLNLDLKRSSTVDDLLFQEQWAGNQEQHDEWVIGRDEMNLAEFPLSSSKRSPGDLKTLHFEDEVWDRSLEKYVPRKLTITEAIYWAFLIRSTMKSFLDAFNSPRKQALLIEKFASHVTN